MKIKKFFKIIIFILLSGVLLISLSGSRISEAKTYSNLDVDTSFDETLASINKILERNEQYEHVNSIIKNLEFDSYSYTIHVFGPENNDRQIMNEKTKRVVKIEKIINLHKINFLNANFNLI